MKTEVMKTSSSGTTNTCCIWMTSREALEDGSKKEINMVVWVYMEGVLERGMAKWGFTDRIISLH